MLRFQQSLRGNTMVSYANYLCLQKRFPVLPTSQGHRTRGLTLLGKHMGFRQGKMTKEGLIKMIGALQHNKQDIYNYSRRRTKTKFQSEMKSLHHMWE